MSNKLELELVREIPAQSPLTRKSLNQLKYERNHYDSLVWHANIDDALFSLKGRKVLRFQVRKLDALIREFEFYHQSVA